MCKSRKSKMIEIMNQYPQYREILFARGYFITDDTSIDYTDYPFFGNWKLYEFGKYQIAVNTNQTCYVQFYEDCQLSIIGHAYNPFTMVYDEEEILKELHQRYQKGMDEFFSAVSELTGVHLILVNDRAGLKVVQDCAGLKACCYGEINGNVYISQMSQLIGDVLNLEYDPFVMELVNLRCYNIGNRHLPGNYTPFKELKRLGPNTYLELTQHFEVYRFYPTKAHDEIVNSEKYDEGIEEIYKVLHNNIKLATMKWKRPAISLSGGTDSKTTLACANGLYDKFFYFSFHCKPAELEDANAAHKICQHIGVNHEIYPIADNNSDVEDFDVLKQILEHNTSYFKRTADNEVRKYIFLLNLDEYDVELKSWSSEIARVFFERKYCVKMPRILTERHYSIFQTRYFGKPGMLKKSDEIYRNFLKMTKLDRQYFNFENTDLAYWEVRMGAWGASVVSSFDFCHNVTMPFNNRKLIEMFLTFSHEERKADKVHENVIKLANHKIHDLNVEISNNYFKFYRIWLEKIYYYYRTLFFKSKN